MPCWTWCLTALVDGQTVKLSSFGTFMVRAKRERMGRNPKTGEEVPITPRRVLVFRPSQVMKNIVNGLEGGTRGLKKRNFDLEKSPDAFRTISEVAEELNVPQHVLRFWETKFTQIKPMKRAGWPPLLQASGC